MPKLEQLARMLQDEPDDVFLNYALAKALQTAGRSDEAVAQFRKVLTLAPQHVAGHFQFGQALAEMGNVEEARRVLQAGIAAAARAGDHHAVGEMTGFLETL